MPVGTFGLLNAGLLGAIPAPRSSETASPVTAVAVECSARTSAERSRSGLRGATRVPNRPAERRLDVVGVAAAVVHVARLERHLAVAARYVEDVGWQAEARDAAAELAHQRLPFRDRNAEMGGPAGEVGVVQVVRLDARLDRSEE